MFHYTVVFKQQQQKWKKREKKYKKQPGLKNNSFKRDLFLEQCMCTITALKMKTATAIF